MHHPDVLKAYSINNFLYIFKKDCLEINGKDIKWEVTLYDDGDGVQCVQWNVDKYRAPENVGVFMSPGYSKPEDLLGTIFYKQIKHWMDLKESL